jgi:hypothetical protein
MATDYEAGIQKVVVVDTTGSRLIMKLVCSKLN